MDGGIKVYEFMHINDKCFWI